MEQEKTFKGGVPTDPDVQKLLDKYGRPKIGQVFTYEEIADFLNTTKKSNRWCTVTWAWRRQIYRLHNIYLGCERGKAFIALKDSERLRFGIGIYKTGLVKISKAQDLVAGCDDANLTDPEKDSKSHIVKISGSLLMSARMEARKSLPGAPAPYTPTLPRP